MVYQWINNGRSVLFPPRCRLCLAVGTQGRELCSACHHELPWLIQTCTRCALPLAGGADVDVCPACLSKPQALDACHALFGYQPPVDRWVHALKFDRDLAVAHMLGQLLTERLIRDNVRPAPSLLPVPLHPRRLRQRGYNQALELARPLLRNGWLLSRCSCQRKRYTAAQAGLPAHHRRRNLSDAFSVNNRLDGQHVLLIDDVMTTGATLNTLAHALKTAGADRVEAWVIARALKRR